MSTIPILLGKSVLHLSKITKFGSGGTWPGELALLLNPGILKTFLQNITRGIIIIAGTNGKTTTSKMIIEILKKNNQKNIVHNDSGANLLNGITSAFIKETNLNGNKKFEYSVLEVDENTLPLLIDNLPVNSNVPVYLILLNLFRDQLDRYGEVDIISRKWHNALLDKNIKLFANADDPEIAFISSRTNKDTIFFGIDKKDKYLKIPEHATDSTYCRVCGHKLIYEGIYLSHIGVWYCNFCKNKRPIVNIKNWATNLDGLYNEYNALAAACVTLDLGVDEKTIRSTLLSFKPAFGRQEEIIINGKKVKIFLSKNPAGFNATLNATIDKNPNAILFVLNDRIPDGRDVSWIWDVDFEIIPEKTKVIVSGDRVFDMALRIKYTYKQNNSIKNDQMFVEPKLKQAIKTGLSLLKENETLYILATYSAMLETRKILMGRKIL